jgi:hypothetical protein
VGGGEKKGGVRGNRKREQNVGREIKASGTQEERIYIG